MAMKLAVMQPYLFPYIGYFQLINAVDKFVIYDDVNFINKGWINRNKILINGKAYLFTVPLKDASQNKLIRDIEVVDDGNWRSKFLKTIEMSYKKAPYYGYVFPIVSKIILSVSKSISELIRQSIIEINQYLNIGTIIQDSSAIYNNRHLKAEDRIINICRKEGADQYINPSGGTELYSKERFEQEGITLSFMKSENIDYRQLSDTFVPWLSIIDVLMFNSTDKAGEYLDAYELI
jgi:hypothetical protein